MTFEKFGLGEPLLRAISDAGYREPTPIQTEAIPVILEGRDVLGLAQTGTGKTASFTLPMIETLARGVSKARMPRSLILEPTRELAAQLVDQFKIYGKYQPLKIALLIGGVSFEDQNRILERGADVLVATPGRLLDHMERGRVLLNGVQILTIDEADRMLDMGFIPDIEKIVRHIPPSRQTLLFSATMPSAIEKLADNFMRDPARVEVARRASVAEGVEQNLIWVEEKRKLRMLESILRSESLKTAIIFCNRKRDVSEMQASLIKMRFNAGALHGDMNQPLRMKTLERFRAGDIQILVASNVAARGLDIMQVSHIFLFDVPRYAEDYVHRIGRTGRAGEKGVSFMLASYEEADFVEAVEALIKTSIPLHKESRAAPGGEMGASHQSDAPSGARSGERRKPPRSRRGQREDRREDKRESAPRARPKKRTPFTDKQNGGQNGRRNNTQNATSSPSKMEEGHMPAFMKPKGTSKD